MHKNTHTQMMQKGKEIKLSSASLKCTKIHQHITVKFSIFKCKLRMKKKIGMNGEDIIICMWARERWWWNHLNNKEMNHKKCCCCFCCCCYFFRCLYHSPCTYNFWVQQFVYNKKKNIHAHMKNRVGAC